MAGPYVVDDVRTHEQPVINRKARYDRSFTTRALAGGTKVVATQVQFLPSALFPCPWWKAEGDDLSCGGSIPLVGALDNRLACCYKEGVTTAPDYSVLFSSTAYRKADDRGDLCEASCACCGRETKEEFYVELPGQGFYPVGPECFKKCKKAGLSVRTKVELFGS